MATKTILIDSATGQALETQKFDPFGAVLTVVDPLRVRSVFKSTKFTVVGGTGSTTVATPRADGSIILVDLVISFEKKTTAEVTLQFNDGTNSELVWFMDMQDAPVNLAIAFAGRWQGWQSAYLEIVVTGVGLDGSIGVGYAKVTKENSLKYAEWNARR